MLSNEQCRIARMSKDVRFDGMFFTAVKTTKIYCRPVCRVRAPKEENVEYFQFAVEAAQNGYRPCLRCRPDSAPLSNAWKGTHATLDRAMKLLRDNEANQQNLVEISARLGVSDRYLRQLFSKHLGVSPNQYRIYHNLLFAKQLLHQTSLPVSDVAFASGFNSIRQFNDSFKQNFNLSPTKLRTENINENKNIKLKLAFRPPYNWEKISQFLSFRSIDGMECVTEESYSRVVQLKNHEGDWVSGWFNAVFNEKEHCFDVDVKLDDLSLLKQMINNISRCLDVDADIDLIEGQLEAAGVPADLVVRGLRVPGVWSTFEAGIRAIFGQQVSVKAAHKLVKRLVDEVSNKSLIQPDLLNFPTPEQVAALDLTFLSMPERRKNTLKLFTEYYVNSENPDYAEKWIDIKGIGKWTIDYALFRGQSNTDIWLEGDLGVKKAAKLFSTSLKPEKAKPWQSYLTFQMWQHL